MMSCAGPSRCLRRKDGQQMTDEDDDALLEFGAYHVFFGLMASLFGMNEVVDGESSDEEMATPDSVSETRTTYPLADLERVDGRHFTDEDEHALLEFGGIFMFFRFTHFCLRGIELAIEGVNGDQDNEDFTRISERLAAESRSPFAHIQRRDGQTMTQEDEDALLEFSHLLGVYQLLEWLVVLTIINWDVSRGFGIFPAADRELVCQSERLSKSNHNPVTRLDDSPMSQEDEDALAPYGAFVVIGQMASMAYSAIFGNLVNVPIKTKQMDNKIKRTPSGAELSATLGLTVKKSLGLDDKSRKVKIRGLI
jgi:hypothetical protein